MSASLPVLAVVYKEGFVEDGELGFVHHARADVPGVGLARSPGGVSEWLHVAHTGCHQLSRVLTA